jgi:hypothetical protein
LGLPAAKETRWRHTWGKCLAGDFTAEVAAAKWKPVAEVVARAREWERATGWALPLPKAGEGAVWGSNGSWRKPGR